MYKYRGYALTGAFLGFVLPYAHGHNYFLGAVIMCVFGAIVGLLGGWLKERQYTRPPT